jgi:DNA-binding NtrC family response regulator
MKTKTETQTDENRPMSIFLVDDDKMFLTPLKHVLLEKIKPEIEITTFSDGEECVKRLDEKPDIVILDYYLNGANPEAMNGIDVLRHIKDESKETMVLMLSAQDNVEVAAHCVKHGAYDYVTKSESAFIRVENSVNNIISKIILSRQKKDVYKWNYIVAGIVLLVLALDMLTYYIVHFLRTL